MVRVMGIWGNFSVAGPLPEGHGMLQVGGKKHRITGVLCLEVFSSKKITFMGFESEPFHTENFVKFPLCPPLP